MQLIPSPEKPGLQEQLNDPLLLLQTALRLQLSVLMAHSSMSKQILKKKQISGINWYLFSIKIHQIPHRFSCRQIGIFLYFLLVTKPLVVMMAFGRRSSFT